MIGCWRCYVTYDNGLCMGMFVRSFVSGLFVLRCLRDSFVSGLCIGIFVRFFCERSLYWYVRAILLLSCINCLTYDTRQE